MKRPLLAPAALLLGLSGCYETPQPACAFACSQAGDCPAGYSCRPDAWCRRDDVGDEAPCPGTSPDLDPPQDGDGGGATADASPDATPDANPDASQPDASSGSGSAS